MFTFRNFLYRKWFVLAAILYLQTSLAWGGVIKLFGDKGIEVTVPKCPEYLIGISSTLHLDETVFMGNASDKQGDFPSGALLRRLYVSITGQVKKNWGYEFFVSFRPTTTPTLIPIALGCTQLDFSINYTGFKNTNLIFGQVPIPSSLENWGNYNDLLLIDFALPVAGFFPEDDYGFGLYFDRTFQDTYTLAGAIYQPRQEVFYQGQRGLIKSDRWNAALRYTFSPIHNTCDIIHFGSWLRYQTYLDTLAGQPIPLTLAFQGFSTEPEGLARNTGSFLNTGPIRAQAFLMGGLEAAFVLGPWIVQAEYMGVYVRRDLSNTLPAFPDPALTFSGYYIETGYVLTGEPHRYEFATGTFIRPDPCGPWGAFEIALRYSEMNLTNRDIYGGKEQNITLGFNWYINNNVRISTNYVYAAGKDYPSTNISFFQKRKLNILAMRLQMTF